MNGIFPAFALLTDFGLDDPYAGQIKAALFSGAPDLPILDVSHNVPPFAVATGAFFLAASRPHYPQGTIFLCIVDPGVGSERELICVSGVRHILLGPDNGLPALAYADMLTEGPVTTNIVAAPPGAANTFHGRDVLAPAAVRLARGDTPAQLGPPLPQAPFAPVWTRPKLTANSLVCSVLHVDRFGNCISNIPNTSALPSRPLSLCADGSGRSFPLLAATHYAQLPEDLPGVIPGSQGFYELACNRASASEHLRLKTGDVCRILLE